MVTSKATNVCAESKTNVDPWNCLKNLLVYCRNAARTQFIQLNAQNADLRATVRILYRVLPEDPSC